MYRGAELPLASFEDRLASPLACLAFLSFLQRKLGEAGRAMTEARRSSMKVREAGRAMTEARRSSRKAREARVAAPGAHHLEGASLASLAFFEDRLASPLACQAFPSFLRGSPRFSSCLFSFS